MKIWLLLVVSFCAQVAASELSPLNSINTQIDSSKYYIELSVSNDGSSGYGKAYNYIDGALFYYGEFTCNFGADVSSCDKLKIFKNPRGKKREKGLHMEKCKAANSYREFYAYEIGYHGFVFEKDDGKEVDLLDGDCAHAKIIPSKVPIDTNNGVSMDIGAYLGSFNKQVIFLYASKEAPHVWHGVGKYDVSKRTTKIIASRNVRLDFGLVSLSKNGELAMIETERRPEGNGILNIEKLCIYSGVGEESFGGKLCRQLTPLDASGSSVSIEAVALSENGRYLVISFVNDAGTYDIINYRLTQMGKISP